MSIPEERLQWLTTLTRYLYSRIEVKQSLFVSLLQRDVEQSLFWVYELYYSGFQEESFEFVLDIYDEIYAELNPTLKPAITNLIEEWETCEDNSKDCNLGSIIYTLSQRKYNLVNFVKSKLSYTVTKDSTPEVVIPECIITLLPEHIEKYKTHRVSIKDGENAYDVLKKIKLYPSIKDYNNLFNTCMPDKFAEIYKSDIKTWLFYAAESPVWLSRIEKYEGTIDYENQTVHFHNEDNEQEFCELWNYDPNELPSNIQELSIGNGTEKQQTIKQFCKKFKHTVTCKVTIRKTSNKSEDKA
jgi:hypothetical protein